MHLKTTLHGKLRSVLPYVWELTAQYKYCCWVVCYKLSDASTASELLQHISLVLPHVASETFWSTKLQVEMVAAGGGKGPYRGSSWEGITFFVLCRTKEVYHRCLFLIATRAFSPRPIPAISRWKRLAFSSVLITRSLFPKELTDMNYINPIKTP